LRIRPEFSDNNGKIFWRLKSYDDESTVLLQGNSQNRYHCDLGSSKFSKRKRHADIKIEDEIATAPEEKWFVYGPEKKEEVDKYISSR